MGPEYYKHSGKFSPGGVIVGLVASTMCGAALAAGYAYLELYIPLAGVITFILTAGFGCLLGAAAGKTLKWQKVRNTPVTLVVALVVTATSFYVSWAVWIYAALRRADVAEANLQVLLMQPNVTWAIIQEVNRQGAWTVTGWTPTGGALWGIWALEALLIFGLALLIAKSLIEDDPFCEACEKWCAEAKDVARVAMADPAEMKSHMEMKDYSFLEHLGGVPAGAAAWMSLNVHTCPNCRNMHTLSVKSTTITKDKKGKESKEQKEVVNKLLLTTTEAETIRALGQKFAAPAAAAAPTP